MTAVNYDIPLNVVLFNNASMGLIRKNQHQHYQDRYINCDFINPDFATFAKALGINHTRIENQHDIEQLFSDHRLEQGINLIEIPIARDLFPNYSSKR
jgi:acetolactate synthase-1/2/3 large subunit